nr:hypothetical protein [Tanacetum cinerariifolium]
GAGKAHKEDLPLDAVNQKDGPLMGWMLPVKVLFKQKPVGGFKIGK